MKNEKILYLGLDPTRYSEKWGLQHVVHYPIIKITPCSPKDPSILTAFQTFSTYSHLIITSRSTISILIDFLSFFGIDLQCLRDKKTLVVGQATGDFLKSFGISPSLVAKKETAEGLISEIQKLDKKNTHFFYPHSSRARPILKEFLKQADLTYTACNLYETETHAPAPLPNLHDFNEIVFTSPSTVDAFLQTFKKFPTHVILTPIGPITGKYLKNFSKN